MGRILNTEHETQICLYLDGGPNIQAISPSFILLGGLPIITRLHHAPSCTQWWHVDTREFSFPATLVQSVRYHASNASNMNLN